MSKTIDEKVVEMRFDNKHFESNVQTSLSTLDKLKQKLNLTGASKGLENVGKAADKVSFVNMENSLAALEKRFSTTGIMGMTVIQNLTNSLLGFINTAKNFSIGGILEGGKSRATKIENARFQIKGLLKDYKDADERLNKIMEDVNYGVQDTAYGLDAAATVAAQLVASGMEAGEGMQHALRGISGVAAMTNSSYEDIGRIYTSVAGNGRLMGEQLLQLSTRGMNAAAVLAKALNKSEADIRKMVSKGQIDFATFSKAMDDAFGAHAKDANKTLNGVLSNIRAALSKIGADFYGPIIAEESPLVLFLNSVRERINEIRKTLSPITEQITKKINKMFTSLNKWFTGHNFLGFSPLAKFRDILTTISKPMDKLSKTIKNSTKTLKDYEKVVNEIIMGKWKNAPERYQLLTKAGYDWATAQNMVNEKLGSSVRHATKFKIGTDKAAASEEKMSKETKKLIEQMVKLSDEQLKQKGYSKEQIKAFRTLAEVSNKTGLSISKILDLMNSDSFNARFLIFNSFKNVGSALVSILKSIGKALGDVFKIKPEGLFDVIAGFHKLTELIKNRVKDNADKLTRTLRGLFSIIHIIGSFIGSGFKLAFQVLQGVLGAFNLTILDFTALIGDAIYNFDRWLTENNLFIEGVKMAATFIKDIIVATIKWVSENEKIMNVLTKVKDTIMGLGKPLEAWIKGLKEADSVPKYILDGLVNGLKTGASKVFEIMTFIGQTIITAIRKVLRINSPSKEMFEVGKFVILGLINGIKTMLSSLWNFLKGIGTKISGFFSGINISQVIAVGISAGILLIVKKMTDIVKDISSMIAGFGDTLRGLGNMLTGLGNAATGFGTRMKYEGIASIIKSISTAILKLVAALWILAQIPEDDLKRGGIALGIITGALASFTILVAALSKRLSMVKLPDMGKTLSVILGLSVGMYIMSKALKGVAKIEPDRMNSAIKGMIACTVALGVLIGVIAGISKYLKGVKNLEKLGKVLTSISTSMLLLSIALRLLSKVQPNDIWKMVGIFTAVAGLLTAIAVINRFTKKGVEKSADTIRAVASSLLLLVIAMKISGMLKPKDFQNGLKVIGIFIGMLTALLAISKIFKTTELVKVGASILMITGAIGMLGLTMSLLTGLDPNKIWNGIKAIGALSVLVGVLIAVSKNSGSLHGTTLVGIAAVILAMSAAVALLGMMDPDKVWNGIKAVGALSTFVSLLLVAAKGFNAAKGTIKVLYTITVMMALLSAAMVGLSFIEPDRLLSAAGSLGIVMTALSLVMMAAGKLKPNKKIYGILAEITLMTAAMAGILAIMSQFTNPESAISSAISLSGVMLAVAGVMTILKNIKVDNSLAKKIGLMTLMAVPLAAFALILAGMSAANVTNAVQNTLALSMLAGVMTVLLGVLSIIGSFPISNIVTGILGLTGMAIPLLAFVGILMLMNNVNNAISNVKALTLLASAMALLLIPLTAIGLVATTGIGAIAIVAGILALTAMAVPLVAFVGILSMMSGIDGAISNSIALTNMMEKLVDMLVKVSLVAPLAILADAAIFGLIGAITTVGVLTTAVGALMEKFPKLQEFLDKGLPVLEQVALGIGKILGNVVAGFTNSIAEELPHLGSKLSEFMVAAMPFITLSKLVDSKVMDGVKILAGSILALTGANLVDAAATWLSGGQSFGRLGTELSTFITSAKPFIDIMSKVNPKVMEGAKSLSQAVLTFTEGNFLNTITGWLSGESDLGSFGEKLAPLGTGLSSFVTNLGTFKKGQVSTIECGCEALKKIAEAAKVLPNEGGIAAFFAGDNDIEAFSDKLPKAGAGIRDFVTELTKNGEFDDKKVATMKAGCEALKTIAEVAKDLPNEGGLASVFAGDNDISKFAGKLGDVGASIRGFVWELNKDNVIDSNAIERVKVICEILKVLGELNDKNLGSMGDDLKNMASKLGDFGSKLVEFIKSINVIEADNIATAKEKLEKVLELVTNICTYNSDPLESFTNRLKTFGSEAINTFVKSLSDIKPKTDAENAIKNVIDAVLKAADSKKSDIETKCKQLGELAVTALKNGTNGVDEVGKNFVQGFANGINNHTYLATNAGSDIGKAALNAAKRSIDSHSPSKETHKLGNFFGIGFINGIREYMSKAYDQSYSMADRAKQGLSKAISKVSDLITNGIDDQPMIRPVLDLSDVQSGAAALNGMFATQSIGISSNLNAISSGMRSYRQNGGEEIVSAIDSLSKKLGNTNSNTYNINGITYDDGSNVSEAVETLVRAARIERRR